MKIGLFIDIHNLYCGIKRKYETQLNYERMLDFVKTLGTVDIAHAYGTEVGAGSEDFKRMLSKIGIKPKYLKRKTRDKYIDCNVPMVVDMMHNFDDVDAFVICSADGRLSAFVKHAIVCGKRVVIIAIEPSKSLKVNATSTIEISESLLCS